jgi:hypothetical protein
MAIRMGAPRHASQVQSRRGLVHGLRIGLCIAVAIAASVALLAATHTSLKTTASLQTSSEISGFQSSYNDDLCIRREFERLVPKGVLVYAGDGFGTPNQLILEAATLWAKPVPEKSGAQWIATIQPGKGCFGYVITAHRQS